jgi:hypothetical protein
MLTNATSSYGSAALLAELDATLKQFPTVRCTLYAFNGDVPAFYAWLQLEVPSTPAGTWHAIPPAPIAGRDGPAAVWTGHQLLVWGGHSRIPNQGLRPLRDGAAYDPASDRWQPIPSAPAGVQGTSIAAVWTGSRMLVWVGNAPDGRPSAPAMTRPGAAGGGSPQPARTAGVLQRGVDRRGVARVRRQQRGRAPDTRRSRLPAGHRPLAGPAGGAGRHPGGPCRRLDRLRAAGLGRPGCPAQLGRRRGL